MDHFTKQKGTVKLQAKDVSGVILAGGKSIRMGQDKATLKWGETDILNHIVKKLFATCKEILVVSNLPRYLNKPAKLVTDIIPNCGPLSGIHAGLCHAQHQKTIIVGCDMPFIDPLFLEMMLNKINGFDAVVPIHSRGKEFLCACYTKNCIPIIERLLQCGDNRVSSLLEEVNCFYYPEEQWPWFNADRLFCNLNTYEDYQRYLITRC